MWIILLGLGPIQWLLWLSPLVVPAYMVVELKDGSSQTLFVAKRRRWLELLSAAIAAKAAQPAAVPAAPAAAAPARVTSASADPLTALSGSATLDKAKAMLDRLEQLARLRDQGVLTPEEFTQQKVIILKAA